MRSLAFKFTIGLACCALLVLSVMPGVSAASRKDYVIEFSDNCYHEGSYGYYGSPRQHADAVATLESTHAAVSLRKTLGLSITSATDYSQAANLPFFVSELENDDKGGYRNLPGEFETVETTFWALHVLNMLNQTAGGIQTHLNFTLNSTNVNGGFGSNPGSNSTPSVFSTYHAVKILTLNASLDLVNASKVHGFLESCKISNGYAGTPGGALVSIVATSMALALYQGPLVAFWDSTIVGPFIVNITAGLAAASVDTGGFIDAAFEQEPSIYTTYHVIAIAKALGISLPGAGEAMTISWLTGLQNPDGGFSDGASKDTSSLTVTRHAVNALHLLDPSLSMLNQQAPWSLVPYGGIIAAIVIIAGVVVVLVVAWQVKKRNKI